MAWVNIATNRPCTGEFRFSQPVGGQERQSLRTVRIERCSTDGVSARRRRLRENGAVVLPSVCGDHASPYMIQRKRQSRANNHLNRQPTNLTQPIHGGQIHRAESSPQDPATSSRGSKPSVLW